MTPRITIVRRALNLWWAWRHRCRNGRMSSGRLPTAAMAISYLHYLSARYEPCPVCGSLTCRWAKARTARREFTAAERQRYRRIMRFLGAGESLARAGEK